MASTESFGFGATVLQELDHLEGGENGRRITIAFFCLTVYDWFLTLHEEVEHFWPEPLSISKALFLVNRYMPPAIMMCVCTLGFGLWNPSDEVCRPAIQASFILNAFSISVVQAMLVLRFWYLFADRNLIRVPMTLGYLANVVLTLYFTIVSAADLEILRYIPGIQGCRVSRPAHFWRIYLPSLVVHTLLFVLMLVRAVKNRHLLQRTPLFKRILRDVAVGFTAIGSFFHQYPKINVPSIYSSMLLGCTSVALSRVLLSVHSLAAKLGSRTPWALNNIELSRLSWRQGSTEGEIVVEKTFIDEDETWDPQDLNERDRRRISEFVRRT
ncbi:hypothetical protein BD626DRAFT_476571 [Schizophyllum amplum]|uniref:DUF6533 domain-containing protein n=1 Tax=Schizophyllum amplum TaxID=97359 RepID=A0A550CZI0_9AGAR|nr:hypothetical protein BD626DRAFT_476571 [Auriculariopsis ampla]